MNRAITLAQSVRNESRNSRRLSAAHSIRILILPRGDIRPLFYFEPTIDEDVSEHDGMSESQSSFEGFRNWIWTALERVRHIEQHVPERFRHPIIWLKSRLPADERLLMALRRAKVVQLVHPTSMTEKDVSTAWATYLDSRLKKRIFWFVFYTLILIPSIILAVLPGPNFLGVWVTYRLVAHGIAMYAVFRALRSRIAVEQVPNAILDGPFLTQRNEANRIQEYFQMLGLKARLKRERIFARLRRRRAWAAQAKSRVEEQP